jgi:hypothetical protein
MVGRPGLDPGTLGLKGVFGGSQLVALVSNSHFLQGAASPLVGPVSWCCIKMTPKARHVRLGEGAPGLLLYSAVKV